MPNPAGAGLPNAASYGAAQSDTIPDEITELVWQATVDDATYTHADATPACATKGATWRLPTRIELVSLVDFTVPFPGPTINQAFAATPAELFWTSTPVVGNANSAWGVFFDNGYAAPNDVGDLGRVRCVRAPATTACDASRYQPKAAGEIYDAATGLTWQQAPDASSHDWERAKTRCTAPGAGWRLPSMTELQTIVDDTRQGTLIDPVAFPDAPASVFWTSSPVAGDPAYAWGVDFSNGTSINPDVTTAYNVRCVR